MLKRQYLAAIGLVALGGLLGYAAASGKLSFFGEVTAAPETRDSKPVAALAAVGLNADPALLAHNQAVKEGAEKSGKKPNICIIWGDDIGQSNVSAYSRGVMEGEPEQVAGS